MKKYIYITTIVASVLVGCATQTQYKTLYTVGKTTDSVVKGYVDLVIAHKVSTNGLPKVSKLYNKFQLTYQEAVKAAQYKLTTFAPTNVIAESADVIDAVNIEKAGGNLR